MRAKKKNHNIVRDVRLRDQHSEAHEIYIMFYNIKKMNKTFAIHQI